MCKFKTKEGLCKLYSVDGFISHCIEGPCPDDVPTNADHIRSTTDEELAIFLSENMDNLFAKRRDEKCAEHCLEWLQQPY